jgi:hypothetical protein
MAPRGISPCDLTKYDCFFTNAERFSTNRFNGILLASVNGSSSHFDSDEGQKPTIALGGEAAARAARPLKCVKKGSYSVNSQADDPRWQMVTSSQKTPIAWLERNEESEMNTRFCRASLLTCSTPA